MSDVPLSRVELERQDALMFRIEGEYLPELLPIFRKVAAKYQKRLNYYVDIQEGGEMSSRQGNLLLRYQELSDFWDSLVIRAERHIRIYGKCK